MLVKGIIKKIDYEGNTCTVRIPTFESHKTDEYIVSAAISNQPGCYNGYKEDDVVWIGFDTDQYNQPVVLGKLYLGAAKEKEDPRGVVNAETTNASTSATIPFDTKLSNIVDPNIPNTQATYTSLQKLSNQVNETSTSLEKATTDFGNRITQLVTDTDNTGAQYKSLIQQTAREINAKVTKETTERIAGEEEIKTTTSAELKETAANIQATVENKVDTASGSTSKGFGWSLSANDWKVFATADVASMTDAERQDLIAKSELLIQGETVTSIRTDSDGNPVKDDDGEIILDSKTENYFYVNGVKTAIKTTNAQLGGSEEHELTLAEVELTLEKLEDEAYYWKLINKTDTTKSLIVTVTDAEGDINYCANTKPVLVVTENGLSVTGTISATDGQLGKFIIGKESTAEGAASYQHVAGITADNFVPNKYYTNMKVLYDQCYVKTTLAWQTTSSMALGEKWQYKLTVSLVSDNGDECPLSFINLHVTVRVAGWSSTSSQVDNAKHTFDIYAGTATTSTDYLDLQNANTDFNPTITYFHVQIIRDDPSTSMGPYAEVWQQSYPDYTTYTSNPYSITAGNNRGDTGYTISRSKLNYLDGGRNLYQLVTTYDENLADWYYYEKIKPTAIYSKGYLDAAGDQITSFNQTPKGNSTGVYLGTDGLRLGPDFSVSASGIVTAPAISVQLSDLQSASLINSMKQVNASVTTYGIGTTTDQPTDWYSSVEELSAKAGECIWSKTVVSYLQNGSLTYDAPSYAIMGVGATGASGENGKSAYELYKESNPSYTGTEADWLTSLQGADGKTTYTWVKYADDENGTNLTDDSTDKTYIGLAYNRTEPESDNVEESNKATNYTWSLIKGDDGVGIESIEYSYLITSTIDTPESTNSSFGDIDLSTFNATNKYLWQKETIRYSNGTSKVTVALAAVYGDTGAPGKDGTNGKDGVNGKDGANGYSVSSETVYLYQGTTANVAPSATTAADDKLSINIGDWSADVLEPTVAYPYIWTTNYTKVTEIKDSSTTVTYLPTEVVSQYATLAGYVDILSANGIGIISTSLNPDYNEDTMPDYKKYLYNIKADTITGAIGNQVNIGGQASYTKLTSSDIFDANTTYYYNAGAGAYLVYTTLTADNFAEKVASAEGVYVKGFLDGWAIKSANTTKNESAAIYSGNVTEFKDASDLTKAEDTTGVYIGTDGIRLGNKFSVDATGQVSATGLKINLTDEQTNTIVKSIKQYDRTEYYYGKGTASDMPITWYNTITEVNASSGDYIWTWTKTYYNDSTSTDSYSVEHLAENGDTVTTDTIYKLGDTIPETPSNQTTTTEPSLPEGWSTTPLQATKKTGEHYCYVCDVTVTHKKDSANYTTTYSAVSQFSSYTGIVSVTTRYLQTSTNYTSSEITKIEADWIDTRPDNKAGYYVWTHIATAYVDTSLNTNEYYCDYTATNGVARNIDLTTTAYVVKKTVTNGITKYDPELITLTCTLSDDATRDKYKLTFTIPNNTDESRIDQTVTTQTKQIKSSTLFESSNVAEISVTYSQNDNITLTDTVNIALLTDGIDGKDGKDGTNGKDGAKGDKGDTGDQGIQGEPGEKGDKGDTGETGAQGEKGDKGEKGADGKDGTDGENGLAVLLTDPTITLLGNESGVVADQKETSEILVYSGFERLTADSAADTYYALGTISDTIHSVETSLDASTKQYTIKLTSKQTETLSGSISIPVQIYKDTKLYATQTLYLNWATAQKGETGETGVSISTSNVYFYYANTSSTWDETKAYCPKLTYSDATGAYADGSSKWSITELTPSSATPYVWQWIRTVTITKSGTDTVASTISCEDAEAPMLFNSLDGLVSILSADGIDIIAKETDETTQKDIYHIKADTLTGAVSNSVTIGGFTIRADETKTITNEDGTTTEKVIPGAIYSGGDNFANWSKAESTSTSESGVCISSEGIKLGSSFSVDSSGNVTGASFKTIDNMTTTYAIGSSMTTHPDDASFGSAIPETTASNPYLWSKSVTKYTNGTEAEPVYAVSTRATPGCNFIYDENTSTLTIEYFTSATN